MTPKCTFHKCILLITCVLLGFYTQAQTPAAPITFGKVDLKDLQMKNYPKDTAAEAVVLCDYGEYSYDFGKAFPKVFYKHHVRIKILKKGGFEYASQKIPYYFPNDLNKAETISNLKAITWNLEYGSQVWNKMEDKDFFDEKGSDDIYYKKFTFPQVQEGSVLEYTYEIESGLWYRLRNWNFQIGIPTVWSELRAEIPAYFDYKITLNSLFPLKVHETKEGTQHIMRSKVYDPYFSYRFAMEDVPALKKEPFLTTLENYRAKLNFELAATHFPYQGTKNYTQTWEQLNETLLISNHFGKQIERYDEAKVIAKQLKTTAKDELDLLKIAYVYIQSRMQWNEENGVFTSATNLNKVAEMRLGNAAEINLMLVRLLRECGFDANPMILSTRDHGLPTDLVLLDGFNFTIAHVDLEGDEILLDASNKYIQFGMLPLQCLNEKGRLVVKNYSRWVEIPTTQVSRKVSSIEASILSEQKISGKVKFSYEGQEAVIFRTSVNQKGKEVFSSSLKKAAPNQSITKIDFTGIDSLEVNPEINIQTTYNEAYNIAGSLIYFTPMLGEVNNPFKSPIRYYPVEYGVPQEEIFSATFKIPTDYIVEEVPKGVSVILPNNGGRFDYRVTLLDSEVKVDSKVSLKKALYSSEEYGALRELYNRIVVKHAEQIILKKK